MSERQWAKCGLGIVGWIVAGLACAPGALRAEPGQSKTDQQAATAPSNPSAADLRRLANLALQDDAAVSEPATRQIRRYGPQALELLMTDPQLRNSPRWRQLLDAVAQQKDAEFSGLYWHTDLDEALTTARREKKAVLSLRLLGNLTDELSCANSRFFRTSLYPNAVVRALLADRFVLHWQSVRAVPIITIDFGDGRKIRRTITGNSLHLVLDSRGRTIDLLPGLYTSGEFVRTLQQSSAAATRLAALDGQEFVAQRTAFHRDCLEQLQKRWTDCCRGAKLDPSLLIGIDHHPDVWTQLAAFAGDPRALDATARRAVIERGPVAAEVAGRRALSKAVTESPAMLLIRNVSRVINEDSIRNEYYLHVQAHNWLSAQAPPPEGEELVRRVYSELFLSPLDDPWYGLSRPDVFSAIKDDGHIDVVTRNSRD